MDMQSSDGLFPEADLLPLSALQHLVFCERQWALIHLEQQWEENRLTAEGRVLHDNADTDTVELRNGVRICRGLRLRSLRYGIAGRADVVEFRSGGPRPIEYKRGKPKSHQADEVQLCAQALCLEEMLGAAIPAGDLFYGEPRRRTEVAFDNSLRNTTIGLIGRLHDLTRQGLTPPAEYASKCRKCSLIDICQPKATGSRSAIAYVRRALADLSREEAS
jgi:CRISPR-associated exonuclease Cas4